jgi:4-amino-4-deoxy-L-arabinose transferase-like glycosyltransferase
MAEIAPPVDAVHASVTSERAPWRSRHGALLAVCVVLALVALVRLRVADVPLERDEGEYAYVGQLILQGVPPYRLAYTMKFPGTSYAYAAILALFGQTPWGIRIGLLLVNAATALVLLALGRRLIGTSAAAIAAMAFSVLTLDRWSMGVFAHATHFVLLPALAGLWVLLRAPDAPRARGLVGAGVVIGVAVLMKQHALVFLALALGIQLWRDLRRPTASVRAAALRSGLVLAGATLPFALLCAGLAAQGTLGPFWFWAFQYAGQYVSEVTLAEAWPPFAAAWAEITRATHALWLLAAVGLAALWTARHPGETRGVLTGLLVASWLAVCVGFYFRPHYFILLLPVAALLVGVAVSTIAELLARVVPPRAARSVAVAIFAVAVGLYAVGERRYLLSMGASELSRSVYGINPFVETVDVARYVRAHTTPRDRIAVLGSEPQIYFYARRRSATGYLYAYPLMEPHVYAAHMRAEMLRELDAAHPAYMVLVEVPTSWTVRADSDRSIFEWIRGYARACYERVSAADIFSPATASPRREGDAGTDQARLLDLIRVFRRTSDAPCSPGR